MEHRGFEPLTSSMPWKRATNCANAPKCLNSIYNLGGDSKLMACLTSIGRARVAGGGVGCGRGGRGFTRHGQEGGAGGGGRAAGAGGVASLDQKGCRWGWEYRCGQGVSRAQGARGGRKPTWRAAAGGLRLPSLPARHRRCARDCTAQRYALVPGTFPADP